MMKSNNEFMVFCVGCMMAVLVLDKHHLDAEPQAMLCTKAMVSHANGSSFVALRCSPKRLFVSTRAPMRSDTPRVAGPYERK